jgi:hypothetical protein
MHKTLGKILLSCLLASLAINELPASTFGGSTGPRQTPDINSQDLPRFPVDNGTYRRTKARLSHQDVAPLIVPGASYLVRAEADQIIEFNKSFLLVPIKPLQD